MTGETLAILGIVASPLIGGISWTVYKVITHDAWLGHIKATVERIEDKVDRLVERKVNVELRGIDVKYPK